MDFSGATKRHEREKEERRQRARRKLDEQRQNEAVVETMEEGYQGREIERLQEAEEERLRAEDAALLNDGVRYHARLKPFPSARTDDKLELPPSALEELMRQHALEKGDVLTFSVAVPGGAASSGSGDVRGRTHAGVAEFTAEEGTVGVPPRVALCLAKGAGLESLATVGLVEVRFARLPRSAKSCVKLQPRGEGFHANGRAALRMDLEHVLQETLRGHTALSEGDWLPIRHEGFTYELVVRELSPEPQLALLNTDLTVEIMPSEVTEAELREEEERAARAEALQREAEEREVVRIERARTVAATLVPEPPQGAQTVQVLVRLPSGGRITRRFERSMQLSNVLDWVESEPDTRVQHDGFYVVQKWPGHCKEFARPESGQTLAALGFSRQEALFLKHSGSEGILDVDMSGEEEVAEQFEPSAASTKAQEASSELGGEWVAAEQRAHRALDGRLEGEESPTDAVSKEPEMDGLQGAELVGIFQRLVAFGMPPLQAASATKRFSAQLSELGAMGFDNYVEAVRLLEKYNGRLLRVANALSEHVADATMSDSGNDVRAPMHPPVPPSPVPPPVAVAPPAPASAPTKDTGAGLPKERVAAKFKELMASGKPPNEAAAMAIKQVREAVNAEAASICASAVQTAAMDVDVRQVDDGIGPKLQELASMGFCDAKKNEELIRKYGGRIERVIEVLCEA